MGRGSVYPGGPRPVPGRGRTGDGVPGGGMDGEAGTDIHY